MKEYKKQYWPFGVWLLSLAAILTVVGVVGAQFELSAMAISVMLMSAVLALVISLFALIWAGEYVYWINGGPTFEQAKAATSEKRKEYAWRHLRPMLKCSAASVLMMAVVCFLKWPEWLMIAAVTLSIVAAAVSTIRVRWTDERKEE